MYHDIVVGQYRTKEHDVNDIFVERWSPRSFTGEPLSEEDLMSLLEAARWAPSSYNGQPWRFIYGIQGTPAFDALFDLLVEFNQGWANNAGALLLLVSKKTFDHNGDVNRVHSLDAGAAWMSLALQASLKGIVAHGMVGFDEKKAAEVFAISDDYRVEAMIAVGYVGDMSDISDDLRERELPNSRKHVAEFAASGKLV